MRPRNGQRPVQSDRQLRATTRRLVPVARSEPRRRWRRPRRNYEHDEQTRCPSPSRQSLWGGLPLSCRLLRQPFADSRFKATRGQRPAGPTWGSPKVLRRGVCAAGATIDANGRRDPRSRPRNRVRARCRRTRRRRRAVRFARWRACPRRHVLVDRSDHDGRTVFYPAGADSAEERLQYYAEPVPDGRGRRHLLRAAARRTSRAVASNARRPTSSSTSRPTP